MSDRPPPRWFLRLLTLIHVGVYRVSGGRVGRRAGSYEMCMVTMTGAKSGRRRTIPLMLVPDGEAVVLVASQGGAPTHPQWYYNLRAHPDITVERSGRSIPMRAELSSTEERARLWPICVEHYPPYADYQRRTEREIPVFRCAPAGR